MPVLSISIVHHKNRQLLEKCLNSIYRETKDVNFEVFVVDNCSGDGALIKEKYPEVKLIQNDKPEGFAKNHNKVLKIANSKYILILNDDTVILDNAIDKMVKFIDSHAGIGILGCQMKTGDGKLQTVAYKRFPNAFHLFVEDIYGMSGLRKIFPNNWIYDLFGMGTLVQDRDMEVSHLNGACMLVRMEVIDKIGLLDEIFFMFMEETDLCYRAKNAGWKVYYYPKTNIIHYGGCSLEFFSKDRREMFKTSIERFLKKNCGKGNLFIYKLLQIFLFPIKKLHTFYLANN